MDAICRQSSIVSCNVRRRRRTPPSPKSAPPSPLTEEQKERLRAALANATGRNVTLKVVVDPAVLGGVVATIGDTVIDGTVRTHLDQLKSRL